MSIGYPVTAPIFDGNPQSESQYTNFTLLHSKASLSTVKKAFTKLIDLRN